MFLKTRSKVHKASFCDFPPPVRVPPPSAAPRHLIPHLTASPRSTLPGGLRVSALAALPLCGLCHRRLRVRSLAPGLPGTASRRRDGPIRPFIAPGSLQPDSGVRGAPASAAPSRHVTSRHVMSRHDVMAMWSGSFPGDCDDM